MVGEEQEDNIEKSILTGEVRMIKNDLHLKIAICSIVLKSDIQISDTTVGPANEQAVI